MEYGSTIFKIQTEFKSVVRYNEVLEKHEFAALEITFPLDTIEFDK